MPIASHDRPQHADIITTYAELERFVSAFADGKIDNTVLIVGASGLQKSRLVADVLGNRAHTIRGQQHHTGSTMSYSCIGISRWSSTTSMGSLLDWGKIAR